MEHEQQPHTQPVSPPQSRPPVKIILIIIGALLVAGIVAWGAFSWVSKTLSDVIGSTTPGDTPAQTLFRDMTTAASAQKNVQLTVAEKTYNNSGDYASDKTLNELYSIAEYNGANDYRALFITSLGKNYSPAKCFDGRAYASPVSYLMLTTLTAAKQELAKPFTKIEADPESRAARNCDLNSNERKGRLTDGIIPLGMNSAQIDTWFKVLAESEFFTVNDEGMTEYDGKQVRKLSITTNSLAGAAQFRGVAMGAGLDLKGADRYRLDDVNIVFADNISGYYLIDEETKLPVFSEFTSIGLINEEGVQRPGGISKHRYAYPSMLSLGQTSSIPELN